MADGVAPALVAPAMPPEVAAAAQSNASFAGYVIVKPLGQGGSGTVYLAWQRNLGRYVALKVLHQAAPGDVQRFLREVQVEASLSHPHIVPIFDVGQHDGRPYLAMKYIAGSNLGELRVAPGRALELLRDVAAALEYAHQRGIIHRDLKPANLMVGEDGHVWVMDFGLARPMVGGATLTVAGHAVGTPAYMPPEQARGQRCDARSDVYALGATLYELLTGRPPFSGGKAVEVMLAVLREEPPALRQLMPALPVEVEAIVQKAMDKSPGRRYPSAGALAEDLRRQLAGEPVQARPAGLALRARKWVTRHPVASAVAGVAGAALLLLLVGAGLYLADVTRARALAEHERTAAVLKLAQSLVSQGDALGLAGRWGEAQARYSEARTTFVRIGSAPLTAELGMVSAYQNAPPPLQVYLGQPQRITAALFSLDGRQAFSAGEDRTIRLWDVASGTQLRSFRGHSDGVWAIALSSDGKTLVSGSWDGSLRTWEVASGRPLRCLERAEKAKVHSLALAPDGNSLWAGHADGTITVWDLTTGTVVRSFVAHHERVRALAFAPDGRHVVSGGWDGMVKIWDLASAQTQRVWTLPSSYIFAVVFTPDGQNVVAASSNRRIWMWDAASGQLRWELRGHTGFVSDVALSRDGRRAFSASWDGTVRSWDLRSGQPERILGRGEPRLYAVALSPDGRTALAAGEKGSLQLWDAGAQAPSVWRQHEANVRGIAISPDGLLALSGASDRKLVLWDVASGRPLRSMTGDESIEAVAFSHDGQSILSSGARGGVDIWDVATGAKLRTLATAAGGPTISSISTSQDGQLALLGSQQGVSLWSLRTGALLRPLANLSRPRRAVILPDGHAAVVAHAEGSVSLWDLDTGVQRWLARERHDGNISALVVSPDGQLALTGATDNVIKLWNVAKGEVVRSFFGHTGQVRGLALSPDRRWIASASEDHTVRLWDIASGAEIRSFIGHEGRVLGVIMLPDGRGMISSGEDGTLRLWDFSIGAQVLAYADRMPKLTQALALRFDDAVSLAELGRWFTFRGACDLAAQVSERARGGGQLVRSLPLARCYKAIGDVAGARQELTRAAANGEAPQPYLDLLTRALADLDP